MHLAKTLLACALLAGPAFAADGTDGTGLQAGDIAVAEGLRDRALQGSLAWAVVESLTTEVGPRLAGTEADARAVRWAEAKFKAMGFDKVYLE
ncbi:MAG: peptidase M28 family protein, partial [Pseudoxanthomonas sp.]|nr:peptidase M28 family protein [Pseudoxanthomonas sp.]